MKRRVSIFEHQLSGKKTTKSLPVRYSIVSVTIAHTGNTIFENLNSLIRDDRPHQIITSRLNMNFNRLYSDKRIQQKKKIKSNKIED